MRLTSSYRFNLRFERKNRQSSSRLQVHPISSTLRPPFLLFLGMKNGVSASHHLKSFLQLNSAIPTIRRGAVTSSPKLRHEPTIYGRMKLGPSTSRSLFNVSSLSILPHSRSTAHASPNLSRNISSKPKSNKSKSASSSRCESLSLFLFYSIYSYTLLNLFEPFF